MSPALSGRIALAVLIALSFGAVTSPLFGGWVLILLAVTLTVGAIIFTVSLRRRGLRGNNYAPMRSDDETPTALGGNLRPPKSSNDQAQTLLTYAVPTIYVAAWVGRQSSSETVSWIWSAAVTVAALLVMWRVFVLEAESAPGYVPLSRVFAADPDWTPASDADAVASVLYAAHAVPAGRQIRRDVLDELVAPLLASAGTTGTALQSLVGRQCAVELRERKNADTVQRWVALTEEGREAVKAGSVAP